MPIAPRAEPAVATRGNHPITGMSAKCCESHHRSGGDIGDGNAEPRRQLGRLPAQRIGDLWLRCDHIDRHVASGDDLLAFDAETGLAHHAGDTV